MNDPDIATRIQAYRTILTVDWVARFSRIVAGADRKDRLVVRPVNWRETMRKYERYIRLANTMV